MILSTDYSYHSTAPGRSRKSDYHDYIENRTDVPKSETFVYSTKKTQLLLALSIYYTFFYSLVTLFSAVDSFSNPGVLLVIDCLPLFLFPFLNPRTPGVLWHPQHPRYLQLCYLKIVIMKIPPFLNKTKSQINF